MNNVPNSDSKQCTESRLGWVHTLNPGCALGPPYHGVPGAMSWPCCSARPAVSQCKPVRIAVHARPYRVLYCPRRVVGQGAVSRAVSRNKAAPSTTIQNLYRGSPLVARSPSCHDTNDCIVNHLNGQAALLSRYN